MFTATKFRAEICAFILAAILGSALLPFATYSSTCTGSDPCNACKIANTASIARRMAESVASASSDKACTQANDGNDQGGG